MNDSDEEEEEFIAQQAKLAEAKFGGLKKKNPNTDADKKTRFDSADYFKEHENLKEAAGLGEEEAKK